MNRWLYGLLVGLAGGLTALLVERIVFPPLTIAQIDLTGLVNEHVHRPDLMTLPEAERSMDAVRLAARLEQATLELAREYRVVILAAPAVVSGAPDLTPVLRKRIAEPAP
ncbi:MAG: TrbI F-type domain-containing protein [Wenzhouxiangellaceae bacterium]